MGPDQRWRRAGDPHPRPETSRQAGRRRAKPHVHLCRAPRRLPDAERTRTKIEDEVTVAAAVMLHELSGSEEVSPLPAPSEPCVRLSTHTAQANRAGAYAPASLSGLLQPLDFSSDDLLALQPCASSSNSCPSMPFSRSVHLLHVSTLSRGVWPYPAGYVFPLPFDGWPWLLEASCSHGGVSPSLRFGY